MIVCLDTSCLVKLYVEEEDSVRVRRRIAESDAVCLSVIAYPELRGALRRRRADRSLSGPAYIKVMRRLDQDWVGLGRVTVTDAVAEEAGDLAEGHGLRGMDAIHLATALLVRREAGSFDQSVRFLTSDVRLGDAARREKLLLLGD